MAVMKRLAMLMIAAAAVLAAACGKEDKKVDVSGEWELTNVEFVTKSAVIGSETVFVYMSFDKAGTFSIYQKLGEGRYQTFSGTWALSGDVLNGTYSDGKNWACPYRVSRDGDTMIMVSSPDEKDVYTYRKCTIPASAKNGL